MASQCVAVVVVVYRMDSNFDAHKCHNVIHALSRGLDR